MEVKACQLCGALTSAMYACTHCKREVCEACFKPEMGVCSECYRRLKNETSHSTFPLNLFLLGFVLIISGVLFLVASSVIYGDAQATAGIIIFIGPIPIILSTGPYSVFAILLATILTVLGIVFFLLLRK